MPHTFLVQNKDCLDIIVAAFGLDIDRVRDQVSKPLKGDDHDIVFVIIGDTEDWKKFGLDLIAQIQRLDLDFGSQAKQPLANAIAQFCPLVFGNLLRHHLHQSFERVKSLTAPPFMNSLEPHFNTVSAILADSTVIWRYERTIGSRSARPLIYVRTRMAFLFRVF